MNVVLTAATATAATSCRPPRASMTDQLNAGRAELAQVTYEGDSVFGPAMKVQRYRLGNGLRVLLLIDRSAPVVSYHTWVRVGSRDERPGKTGIAHLFEHLMFNETKHLAAGEFDRVLEENGAESNAATWVDWTYYHESLPAPKLGLAVKLEADRLANLVLRDKQVSSEKEVVANERRYRVDDDVEGAVNELLYKTAFETHPYHWPTIGWMDDIQGFTTTDCETFYKTFYAPNNVTVIVVGDVVEHEALRLIQDHYGALPPSQIPPRKLPQEPTQAGEKRLEVKKPTATEKLMLGYKGPAVGDPDHVALTVLNEILFGGRSSRIYRTIIKQRELATDLRGWVSTFADPGLYEMYLTARGAHTVKELEAALAEELAKVRKDDVTKEELEKAKSRLELGFLQGMETASGKAEQIGFYDTVLGDAGAGFSRLDAYRAVTAADVKRVAVKYLVEAHRTTIAVLPDGTAGSAEGDDEEEGEDDGAMAHKLGKGALR
ncbi:MAG: M16 family metallopeptidase [Polyangiales bacterium]